MLTCDDTEYNNQDSGYLNRSVSLFALTFHAILVR